MPWIPTILCSEKITGQKKLQVQLLLPVFYTNAQDQTSTVKSWNTAFSR